MTKLFIDCEFNEYAGELISMAIVSENGDEWYEVLPLPDLLGEWVAANVIPKLNKDAISTEVFNKSLHVFLARFPGCEIIADWPADFEHLCSYMSRQGRLNGWVIPQECRLTLINGSPDIAPVVPHNALSDARALRDWYCAEQQKEARRA